MIANRFILRAGQTAHEAGRSQAVIATVVGTAYAVAVRHLLPVGHTPAINDN